MVEKESKTKEESNTRRNADEDSVFTRFEMKALKILRTGHLNNEIYELIYEAMQ